ncbi:MAG: hypothetical protein J7623_09515 [Chitinophaga sp.]|uniref:hypothetical protein n=1 Tax=Chitinophaga sp. TaxID=1869181 RepID=UPI001B022B2E|nr:hypothetical protein [Chitinophaga sp.]MBO9728862.1 hypothetical protein [Chitinophaga sp.]
MKKSRYFLFQPMIGSLRGLVLTSVLIFCSHIKAFPQVQTRTPVPPAGDSYNFSPSTFYPPPVNAATMNKGGDVSVNLSSGTPNVVIPLFNVKSRTLSLPVTLNYASSGIKVNEAAGIVGLGWSLNYGGVVNRTCYGLPDETRTATTYPNNFTKPDPENYDSATLIYLAAATDRESDVFDFSVNGMIAGRFIFGPDGKAILLEDKNYKVVTTLSSIRSGIEIIDDKGIHYSFNVCDTSTYQRGGSYCADRTSGRTVKVGNAWYLSSIIQPGQDTITFDYISNYHSYYVDVNETESIVTASDAWSCSDGGSGMGCQRYSSTFDNCFTLQTINAKLLQQISFKNGSLRFDYGEDDAIRKDIVGGQYLSAISLANSKGEFIRAASFSYGYFKATGFGNFLKLNGMNNDSSLLYRMVLNKLTIMPSIEEVKPSYDYTFSYLNGNLLPARLSGAQDYDGYNNGKDNSYLITAVTEEYPNMTYYAEGYPARYGDRTPDVNKMQYGLLNKIVYPTGGSDSIVYAFNRTREQYIVKHQTAYTGAVLGSGTNTVEESNGDFIIPFKQKVLVDFKVLNPDPTKPASHNQGSVYLLYDNDYSIYSKSYMPVNNAQTPDSVLLEPASYHVRLTAAGSLVQSIVGISYEYAPPDTLYRDAPIGGMSVSAIISKDPIGKADLKKSYRYEYKETGEYSSFRVQADRKFMSSSSIPLFRSCGAQWNCDEYSSCTYLVHSNSTTTPVSLIGTSAFYHKSVIEITEGKDSIDRCVEYRYKYNPIFYAGMRNGRIANTPYGVLPDYLIGDTLTTFYARNRNTNSITVQKTIQKAYEEKYQRIAYNFNVKKIYESLCKFSPPEDVEYKAFYINDYPIIYQEKKLLSTIETEYALNGTGYLRSSSLNTYNSAPYTLLKENTTQSSKGDTLRTAFQYYWQLNSNALADSVKSRNNISIPAEVTSSVKGVVQTRNTVDYKLQEDNNKIIQPYKYVTIRRDSLLKQQYDVTAFDPFGNVQEFVKDGFVTTLLWDYNSSLLAASVVNAGKQTVAYTSFEADNNGGWTVSGNQRSNADAITGQYAYSLTNGSITKTNVQPNITYYITFWAKGGNVTINGIQATPGVQRKGWTFYEYKFTPSGPNLTINGTALIDELRLFPTTAQMTTYTYTPLIGMTSQCDVRNTILYYTYDGLGRLVTVKNQDGLIVKQYDYQYQAAQTN